MSVKRTSFFSYLAVILKLVPWKRKLWPFLFFMSAGFLLISGGQQLGEAYSYLSLPCEMAGTVTMMEPTGGQGTENPSGTEVRQDSGAMSERQVIEAAQKLDGVDTLTLIWSCPGTIIYGDYQASVTVCGLSPEYLEGEWLQGTTFLPDKAMPQCVINRSAADAFRDQSGKRLPNPLSVNWLSANLTLSGESLLDLRVAGVLDEEDNVEGEVHEAEVYMDAAHVRRMLAEQGMDSSDTQLRIRFSDRRAMRNCRDELMRIGIRLTSVDEGEERIEESLDRGRLYVFCGAVCLTAAFIIMWFLERLLSIEENAAFELLSQTRRGRHVFLAHRLIRLCVIMAEGIAAGSIGYYLIS